MNRAETKGLLIASLRRLDEDDLAEVLERVLPYAAAGVDETFGGVAPYEVLLCRLRTVLAEWQRGASR